jgi:hypothetical protein
MDTKSSIYNPDVELQRKGPSAPLGASGVEKRRDGANVSCQVTRLSYLRRWVLVAPEPLERLLGACTFILTVVLLEAVQKTVQLQLKI